MVHDTDSLTCPKCQGELCIISFIDRPNVIKSVLHDLGHGKNPRPLLKASLPEKGFFLNIRICFEFRALNFFIAGSLDAIEVSAVVPQNLALARLADTVKLQKCLDGARIGRVVVRPIGGDDDVLITHG